VPVITADEPVELGEGGNEGHVALAPPAPGVVPADSLLELGEYYRTADSEGDDGGSSEDNDKGSNEDRVALAPPVPVIAADDPVELGEDGNEDRAGLAPPAPGVVTADSLFELVHYYGRAHHGVTITQSLPGYRLFMRRQRPNSWTFRVVVRDGQHTSHEDKALKRTDPRSLNSVNEVRAHFDAIATRDGTELSSRGGLGLGRGSASGSDGDVPAAAPAATLPATPMATYRATALPPVPRAAFQAAFQAAAPAAPLPATPMATYRATASEPTALP